MVKKYIDRFVSARLYYTEISVFRKLEKFTEDISNFISFNAYVPKANSVSILAI